MIVHESISSGARTAAEHHYEIAPFSHGPQFCLRTRAGPVVVSSPPVFLGRLLREREPDHAAPVTTKRRHSPGNPLSACVPRSLNAIPEPATRSFTVFETRTSPGS